MDPERMSEDPGPEDNNSISNYMRQMDFKSYYSTLNDVAEFIRANPDIQYRYFVRPSKTPLESYNILNFSPENSKRAIDLGVKDAQATIDMGPGKSFARFMNGNTPNAQEYIQ